MINYQISKLFNMKISNTYYTPTNKLKPYFKNARLHNSSQINQIVSSILAFDFINPIITDQDNNIIAGHGRWLAAKKIGLKAVPCICVDHLTDSQVKAYRIADNKLAENAQWDESLLRIELKFLQEFDVHYDFSTLGFETAEIDSLFSSSSTTTNKLDESIPAIPKHSVAQTGDTFECGPHRVACGDSRDADLIRNITNQSSVSLVSIDIPYNVLIEGHARGLGRHQHQNFMMASGEMTSSEYIQFLTLCLLNFKQVCRDGALHYIFCDWRHLYE